MANLIKTGEAGRHFDTEIQHLSRQTVSVGTVHEAVKFSVVATVR